MKVPEGSVFPLQERHVGKVSAGGVRAVGSEVCVCGR